MTLQLITQICLLIAIIFIVCLLIYYLIIAIKNGWMKKLTSILNNAIKEAEEKWPQGHGDEKQAYVLNAIETACSELGIPFSLLRKMICKLINTIIEHYNIVAK